MKTFRIAFFSTLFLLTASAYGDVLTYEISGTVNQVLVRDAGTDAAETFGIGDTYLMTLSYDTDAAPTASNSTRAEYRPNLEFTIQYSNGYSATSTGGRVIIANNSFGVDEFIYEVLFNATPPLVGSDIGNAKLLLVSFQLIDQLGANPFASTSLQGIPTLDSFDRRVISIVFFNDFGRNDFLATVDNSDVIDPDSDGDGILDISDNCVEIANLDQMDNDGDFAGDTCDADDDNDSVEDNFDNCQFVVNGDQADLDGDGLGNACDSDQDGDGIASGDNCPVQPNPFQTDSDSDGAGDECDADDDNDGVPDEQDNCEFVINPDQNDLDADGIGDACDADIDGDGVVNDSDNCLLIANLNQDDTDADGDGDECDTDDDGDGLDDGDDNCPLIANSGQEDSDSDAGGDACDGDLDGDGVANDADNCPSIANSAQYDFDSDGVGDACDSDVDADDVVNASDLCPLTDLSELVDPDTGCSLAQLCPCAGPIGTDIPWRNHGKYVSCVAQTSNSFADLGLISQAEKDDLVSAAGSSTCGK